MKRTLPQRIAEIRTCDQLGKHHAEQVERAVAASCKTAPPAGNEAWAYPYLGEIEHLQLAFALSGIGICDRDIRTGRMVWNDRMYELYGVSRATFAPCFDLWCFFLHPDDYQKVMEASHAAVQGEGGFDCEFRIVLPQGTVKWIKSEASVLRDSKGRPERLLGINRDISDSKAREMSLQATLREKETLLKEIHHRVKNNLQVISSMLSLESHHIDGGMAGDILRESRNRVTAIAAVHTMLGKAKDLNNINFGTHLRDMVKWLVCSYRPKPDAISLSIETTDNLFLPGKTAIPCSLIINELVSNTLKHAFPNNGKGKIRINMTRAGERIKLLFKDNGVGIPDSIDVRNPGTVGLELIQLLVEQLDGVIEVSRRAGTCYSITLGSPEIQWSEQGSEVQTLTREDSTGVCGPGTGRSDYRGFFVSA